MSEKNVINLGKIKEIKMYEDPIKIQINPETLHAHVAIRISDYHVHNFPFELSDAIALVLDSTKEWTGFINGRQWTVQKLTNKVKMYDEDYQFHYRFSSKMMHELRRQLHQEIERHGLHKR